MSYVFISGIPRSGKSSLARVIAKRINIPYFGIDTWRAEMAKDPDIEPWVNLYNNLDELKYLTEISCEEKWSNLVKQSEGFWPFILKKIEEVKKAHKSAVFEAVNILPHLAARDLGFPGIVLLGQSFEQIFERNKKSPKWGKTEELQRLEAEMFFNCERGNYKKEADKYEFKTFDNSKDAEHELINLLKN